MAGMIDGLQGLGLKLLAEGELAAAADYSPMLLAMVTTRLSIYFITATVLSHGMLIAGFSGSPTENP
jgi:hypothetical protein